MKQNALQLEFYFYSLPDQSFKLILDKEVLLLYLLQTTEAPVAIIIYNFFYEQSLIWVPFLYQILYYSSRV